MFTSQSAPLIYERPLSVKEIIIKESIKQGVDPKLALAIATCESSLKPTATNINKDGTRDRGVFQINDYWHPNVSDDMAYDPVRSTEWAVKKLKEGKASLWVCNKLI